MASSKDAIGILFGVLGGGDVNGESYKEINKELDALIDNIDKHDPKFVKLNLDTEDFEKQLSGIQVKLGDILKGVDLSKLGAAIASSLNVTVKEASEASKAVEKVAKAEEKAKKSTEDTRTASKKAYDESKTYMESYLRLLKDVRAEGKKRDSKRGLFVDETGTFGSSSLDMKPKIDLLNDSRKRYDLATSPKALETMGKQNSSRILKLKLEMDKEIAELGIYKTTTEAEAKRSQYVEAGIKAAEALRVYRDELSRVISIVKSQGKDSGAYFSVDKFLPASDSEDAVNNANKLNEALGNVQDSLNNKFLTKRGKNSVLESFSEQTKSLRGELSDVYNETSKQNPVIDETVSVVNSFNDAVDETIRKLQKLLEIKGEFDDIGTPATFTGYSSGEIGISSTPVLSVLHRGSKQKGHNIELDQAVSDSNQALNQLKTAAARYDAWGSPDGIDHEKTKLIADMLGRITEETSPETREAKEIVDIVINAWKQQYSGLKDKKNIDGWVADVKKAASDIKTQYGDGWSDIFVSEVVKRTKVDSSLFEGVTESKKEYVAATSTLVVEEKKASEEVKKTEEKVASKKKETAKQTQVVVEETKKVAEETKKVAEETQKVADATKEQAEAQKTKEKSVSSKKKTKTASVNEDDKDFGDYYNSRKIESQIAEERRRFEKEEQKRIDREHKAFYDSKLKTIEQYYSKEASLKKIAARDSLVIENKERHWNEKRDKNLQKYFNDVQTINSLRDTFDTFGFNGDVLTKKKLTNDELISNAKALNVTVEQYNLLLEKAKDLNGKLGKVEQDARNSADTAWRKNRKTIEEYLASKKDALDRDPRARAAADELQKLIQVDDPKNLQIAIDKYKELLAIVAKNGTDIPNVWAKLEKSLKTAVISFTTAAIGKYLRDVYNQVVRIDSAMTKLRIVTNENEAAIKQYGEEAAATAKKIGVSISSLVNSTTDYAKLGFTLQEASKLAEVTASFARVSDTSTDDATRNITGIVKAYDVQTTQLETLADKLVYVGNNYAISQAEIGEGMNNAASSLQANGNSLNQAIGLLTAANSTVQDIDRASTALRTITARLSASKVQLDSLGEDATGVDTVAKLEEQFAAFGIEITDGNHQLRSTYDIVKQIADRWESLNTEQRNTIAGLAAGTRQQDIFFSLINNFADAEEIVAKVDGSTGSLARATEMRLDSIQGRLDQLGATLEELATNLLDSNIVKNGVSFLNTVVNVLNKIISAADGFAVKMAAIIIGVSSVAKGIKSFGGTRIGLLIKSIKALTAAEWQAAIASKKLNAALKNLGLNPWVIWITAAITVLTIAVDLVKKFTVTLDEQKQALQEAKNAYKESCDELDRLNGELSTIQEKIAALRSLGELSFSDKEQLDNLIMQNDELERQLSIEEALNKVRNKEKNQEFVKTVEKDLFNDTEYFSTRFLDGTNGKLTKYWSFAGILKNPFGLTPGDYYNERDAIFEQAENYEKYLIAYQSTQFKIPRKQLEKDIDQISTFFVSKLDEIKEYTDGISYIPYPTTEDERKVNEYLDYIYDIQDRINIALGGDNARTNSFKRLVDSWRFDSLLQGLQNLGKQGKVTAEMVSDKRYADFVDKLVELGVVAEGDYEAIALAFNTAFKDPPIADPKVVYTAKTFLEVLSGVEKSYDILSDAQADMDKYGILSSKTIEQLLDPQTGYPALQKYLTMTSSGYTLTEDALSDFLDEQEKEYRNQVRLAKTADERAIAEENLSKWYAVRSTLTMESEYNRQKKSLEDQTKAYKKLVDYRKKMLETYKDEVKYQDQLLEKQEDVAKLESKLAVAKLDTSAAGQARVRELEAELKKSRKDLSDFTLDYAVSSMEDTLDRQYDEYEGFIDKKTEQIIAAIQGLQNSENIISTLHDIGIRLRPMTLSPSAPGLVTMNLHIDKVTNDSMDDLKNVVNAAVQRIKDIQLDMIKRTGKWSVMQAPHIG